MFEYKLRLFSFSLFFPFIFMFKWVGRIRANIEQNRYRVKDNIIVLLLEAYMMLETDITMMLMGNGNAALHR